MPRMARLVVPGYPHHVTQRGARRQTTFFCPSDYAKYLSLISEYKYGSGVEIWAYCLMPNHVHLVAIPSSADSLRQLFHRAHRRYTLYINRRNDWRGHLWQERFHSCVMDESHLLAAVRYIEMNPVTAKICFTPETWQWSSTRAHLDGRDDGVVTVAPMLGMVANWRDYLGAPSNDSELAVLHEHQRTGRPVGSATFIQRLEAETGRRLTKRRPGRKRKRFAS